VIPGRINRLPKRKTMTIGIGFQATDGVIICADMQKTIGDMKTYDGKVDLHIFHNAEVTLAIAGAGHDDYIQTAKSYILDGIKDQTCTWPEFESYLRDGLLAFFDTHMARWSSFSIMDRPSVELLIGITGKHVPTKLFHYEGTSFSAVRTKAIGLGILLAQDLLSRYHSVLSMGEAASLATYILAKVKRGVEKCGGPTHIVGLKAGMDFAFTFKTDIDNLEVELLSAEEEENKRFLSVIKSKPVVFSWQSEYKKKNALKR